MLTTRSIRPLIFTITLLILLTSLTACRRNKNQQPDPMPRETQQPRQQQQAAPENRSVTIYKYRFNPNTLTLPVGSTVTFNNKDPDVHNISIRQLNVDRNLKANESFSYTFNQRGTFTVTNRIANAPMQATITIQ